MTLFLLFLRCRSCDFLYRRHLKASLGSIKPTIDGEHPTKNLRLQHPLHQSIRPIEAHLSQQDIIFYHPLSFLRREVLYLADPQDQRRISHEDVDRGQIVAFLRLNRKQRSSKP